jgi:ribose transport system substrate-binding protein
MRKRLLSCLCIVMMLVFVIAGCGDANSNSPESEAIPASETESTEEKILIGVVVNNASADTYQTTWYTAAKEYAKELGVDLQILDPAGDVATQATMIEDLINMDCDVIVVWPVNSETAVSSVKKIFEAGIPVMTANTNVSHEGRQYLECYVGPSNYEEGVAVATVMIEELDDDATICYVGGPPGYSTSQEREAGVMDTIAATNITVLENEPDSTYSIEGAQQIAENWLVKHAKGTIDAIVTFDDSQALGVINAVEAAGRDEIKVYAVACGDYNTISYVESGQLAGVAMQSPIIDAQTALDYALKIAKGETIKEFYNYIETPVATPDNIATLELEPW